MEELQARHRKEQRDLQARVTQKKKQASKKTRKGVNDECDRLEAELKQKHADELVAVDGEHVADAQSSEQLEALTLHVDYPESATEPVQNGTAVKGSTLPKVEAKVEDTTTRKPNRQKARLARKAAEQEELIQQAAQEAQNLPDMKQQERERMLSYMKERSLAEKEIRADGHCLYSAVADQLTQLSIPLTRTPGAQPEMLLYKLTRSAAADWVEQHPEDFEPFLEEPLSTYVHKVRDTGEWGGQLELLALAKSYGVEINVLQDFGRVEKIEPEDDAEMEREKIWLGYYKHGFGLGEHYNSLRKAG
jgi:OTU domain-containing protein 6